MVADFSWCLTIINSPIRVKIALCKSNFIRCLAAIARIRCHIWSEKKFWAQEKMSEPLAKKSFIKRLALSQKDVIATRKAWNGWFWKNLSGCEGKVLWEIKRKKKV